MKRVLGPDVCPEELLERSVVLDGSQMAHAETKLGFIKYEILLCIYIYIIFDHIILSSICRI